MKKAIPKENKGKLFVVSGPSGVGKSTICKEVVSRTEARLAVSATTREKSELEVDGRDYHFITRQEFENRIKNDEFLEWAEVFGNYYGTPVSEAEDVIENGGKMILEIDVQGGLKVKNQYPQTVMIFILPPSQNDLDERMVNRGRGEDEETARKRLEKAGQETAMAWQYYDHMVINAELETAIEEVKEIINNN